MTHHQVNPHQTGPTQPPSVKGVEVPNPNVSEPTEKCFQPSPVSGRNCAQDAGHGDDHEAQIGRGANATHETWPNSGSN